MRKTQEVQVEVDATTRENAFTGTAEVNSNLIYMSLTGYGVIIEAKEAETAMVEMMKSYKELLDLGIITEEEFKIKKKEVLGL